MTKKEFAKINKELAELKKLMEKYTEQQDKNIPADGRWISDNERYNYYIREINVPSFYLPRCCQYCPNNPINNPYSSGICCCSLPDQEMFRW